MSLFDKIKSKVDVIIANIKAEKTKVSVEELAKAFQVRISELIREVENLATVGKEKKEAIMKAAELFYDEVVAPYDIPFLPNFIVEPSFDRVAKSLFLEIMSGMIDGIVTVFNQLGILKKEQVNVGTNP